jgi:hypothetical protein
VICFWEVPRNWVSKNGNTFQQQSGTIQRTELTFFPFISVVWMSCLAGYMKSDLCLSAVSGDNSSLGTANNKKKSLGARSEYVMTMGTDHEWAWPNRPTYFKLLIYWPYGRQKIPKGDLPISVPNLIWNSVEVAYRLLSVIS